MAAATNPVTVLGLGYVGLPLAVALARKMPTTGFDIDPTRIAELRSRFDRTGEVDAERLAESSVSLVNRVDECPPSAFYIVTVPTPIDETNTPDLSILKAATETVGHMVGAGIDAGLEPIVVFESTVYPGVTEEICGPLLEEISLRKSGTDFFLAYSPERINPGDREHTIERITKVVSGQNQAVLERVDALYGSITSGGTFRAASIKAAEAAKVIENAQRDINIAFMNEVSQIFSSLEISVWDVLAAANTKWNFLPFSPGLVGGHCIGVDPYYLAHCAKQFGHDPRVILAGRGVNDAMAGWVADRIGSGIVEPRSEILVLGLTFKEDVPDLRNSKVADLVFALVDRGHQVTVHDPHADAEEARREYGLTLDEKALSRRYDMVLLAVPHRDYLEMGTEDLRKLLREGGKLADLKGRLVGADWTL